MSLTLFAPAKINLWLRVFPPDTTGYHPLDTLFCTIDLADEITLDARARELRVEVVGADVGPLSDNLACRAAREFFQATRLQERAAIRLTKRIPAGAGLGGGSSDAAAVLRGLNQLHGNPLSSEELRAVGARLGSDVAFFLCAAALAHATGYGEILRALPSLPYKPVIVMTPDFAVATVAAYRWLDEAKHYSRTAMTVAIPSDWDGIARLAYNEFEHVVFHRHTLLADFKAALIESGAVVALMSGSGSSLFGIYADHDECQRAQRDLRKALPQASLHVTTTSA